MIMRAANFTNFIVSQLGQHDLCQVVRIFHAFGNARNIKRAIYLIAFTCSKFLESRLANLARKRVNVTPADFLQPAPTCVQSCDWQNQQKPWLQQMNWHVKGFFYTRKFCSAFSKT